MIVFLYGKHLIWNLLIGIYYDYVFIWNILYIKFDNYGIYW